MTMENDTNDVRESMDSKFRYVLLVAERAEQLMRGARPKLEIPGKATRVAREEIDRSLVEWGYGPAPEPELEALPEGADEVEAAAEEEGEGEEAEAPSETEVH